MGLLPVDIARMKASMPELRAKIVPRGRKNFADFNRRANKCNFHCSPPHNGHYKLPFFRKIVPNLLWHLKDKSGDAI